jgi:hypothetical protein
LLRGQQLQNLSSPGGACPFVRKRSAKSHIPPGEKPVQTNDLFAGAASVSMPNFLVFHALLSRFGSFQRDLYLGYTLITRLYPTIRNPA